MIRPQYHFRRVGPNTLIWDVRKLAESARDLPVHDHPLDAIAEIDEPYWFDATDGTATCRAVLAHARQIDAADLTFPILLCAEGRVMDGMHRVMKAMGAGHRTIRARRLPVTPPPDFQNRHPDDLPYWECRPT